MENRWTEFFESFEHLTGFVIVMIALSGLWGLTALMSKVVAAFEKPKTRAHGHAPGHGHAHPHVQAHAAAPAPAAVATSVAQAGPPEDDLVVVAATVASMLGARHRVVAVKPLASSWGQQGRRDIHASHRIR